MINHINTDKEVVQEAARKLAFTCDTAEFDQACIDMIEALRYTQSIEWWKQFDAQPAHSGEAV